MTHRLRFLLAALTALVLAAACYPADDTDRCDDPNHDRVFDYTGPQLEVWCFEDFDNDPTYPSVQYLIPPPPTYPTS